MAAYRLKPVRPFKLTFRLALIYTLKFLISILLIYEGWYIEKYGPIPGLLQVLAVIIVVFTFLSSFGKKRTSKNIHAIGIWWACFGVIALIVGQYVQYRDVVNNALSTYFSFLLICFCVGSVAQYKDDNWLPATMIVVTLLTAFSTTFSGYNYLNGGYAGITMGPNNNPNNLGMMMSIGVFYLLMPKQKQSIWKWMLRIILVGVYLNVIVNTGSRSGVLCLGAIIGFAVLFNFTYLRGSDASKILKRVSLGIACVAAVFLGLNYLQSIGSGTSGINRLLDNFNTKSFGGRTELYLIAFRIFLRKPIFGVGYYGFSVVSNLNYYSHSTYMELLSCTGIVGFLLFLGPVAKGVINSIKYRALDKGRSITLLVLFLAGGFFGILYYNLIFMMLMYWTIINMNKMIREQADDQTDRS